MDLVWFTYVLAGWEGSAIDVLILADALQRPDGLTVPQDNRENIHLVKFNGKDQY